MKQHPTTGTYINKHGAHHKVKILSWAEKTEHFAGGGNPFTVTSVDMELQFDGRANASGSNTTRMFGFLRDGYIGFYTDGEIRSRLIIDRR
jgi:hypothetical protein